MYPDQKEVSASHFLAAATAWFERHGIRTRRILTDHGPCYRAHRFAHACRQLGLTQRRTRAYTPRINGKAERFIKTALNEWVYAQTFQNANNRTASLPS